MPIPERPLGESNKEQEQPFFRAVKYEREVVAARTYFQVQEIVFDSDCDLSVYRFQLRGISHVAILGAKPPLEVDAKLQSTMKDGVPVALPSEVVKALLKRRSQATNMGPWVERHYRPGRPMDTG